MRKNITFESIKSEIEKSVVVATNESQLFKLEADASDIASKTILNKMGVQFHFFLRTLHGSELNHSSVQKEASTIIEAVRHWKHVLANHHFTLKADQKNRGKIKNKKKYRWRIQLLCFSFDIIYRTGKDNILADTFTRVYCS